MNYDDTMDKTIYQAGRDARDAGLTWRDNPYARGTMAYRAWAAGVVDRGTERLIAAVDAQIVVNAARRSEAT